MLDVIKGKAAYHQNGGTAVILNARLARLAFFHLFGYKSGQDCRMRKYLGITQLAWSAYNGRPSIALGTKVWIPFIRASPEVLILATLCARGANSMIKGLLRHRFMGILRPGAAFTLRIGILTYLLSCHFYAHDRCSSDLTLFETHFDVPW
jgi:hypothetical protein